MKGFLTPELWIALQQVLAILVTAAVGWLGVKLNSKLNTSMDADARDALQTALTNAAGSLLQAGMKSAIGMKTEAEQHKIRSAVINVEAAVPEAIKRFDLGEKPGLLAQKIDAKMGILQAAEVPIKTKAT